MAEDSAGSMRSDSGGGVPPSGGRGASGAGAAGLPGDPYLDQNSGDVLDRIRKLQPPKPEFRSSLRRNLFLSGIAAVVVLIVLALALRSGPSLFGPLDGPESGPPEASGPLGLYWSYSVPFGSALAGVLLFTMGVARAKREEWDLGAYFGEYAFRIAQTATYLLIVWWAWARVTEQDIVGIALPPNILGLLVGLFILRVERAIEAMGEKFEEVLGTVLPGSLSLSGPEKRQAHLQAIQRVKELIAQWQVLRPHISDIGARDTIDQAVETSRRITTDRDSERARAAATELDRLFDDVRASAAGERWVSIEDVL